MRRATRTSRSAVARIAALTALLALCSSRALAQLEPVVPPDERGRIDAERSGTHDASNIRTIFYNFGMVGDYPPDPINVDLSVFHSAEVPKGSGLNYSDGITPFVLAKITQRNGTDAYIMETGFRERQGESPHHNRIMRFEPRPGYFQADPNINRGLSPAMSNDPRTWPMTWPDRLDDPDDPGWASSWNGYFGKRPAADLESFTVMDDDFYDAWDFHPDSRDTTRRGLGLRVEVRGFQWANPQAGNVIFWHYDITNEGTTDYDDNVIFGLYMDSGVGGSTISCDGIAESDDDNAFFDKSSGLNLVYTWDTKGHGTDLSGPCATTGYLGYAYLETPGNEFDALDNDEDGIVNESRISGPGELIEGQANILFTLEQRFDRAKFEEAYGAVEGRPAYKTGRWFTGDEDLDWNAELHDVGADGVPETADTGEGDLMPTAGEPYFDGTDLHESDQIGLTGFRMNRIKAGLDNPNPVDPQNDNILFWTNDFRWPERLYQYFTDPNPAARFDSALAANYNIGFLFASGPFILKAGQTERFSLALAYGANLTELRNNVRTVQQIYNANYQFAVPPPAPTVSAETGDGFVRLTWTDNSERAFDPVTYQNDFEGYRIYRATDPEFRDVRVITTGQGTPSTLNGRPIAQFDLVDGIAGYSNAGVEVVGVPYYLGEESGITHTWTDTTATNGQLYYYGVTAYDFGSDSLEFYPSENSLPVSRTPRGGLILPPNVVSVRPEPKVAGFQRAGLTEIVHVAGNGSGTVDVLVANSTLVPEASTFGISFAAPAPESLRAISYALIDSTLGKVAIASGTDLRGTGTGPVGSGLLPVISTPESVAVDTAVSGFTSESATTMELSAMYAPVLPINLERPGFPDDITITFDDVVVDTSLGRPFFPGLPAKFLIVAHTETGDLPLDFEFIDLDADGTLSQPLEAVSIVTYARDDPTVPSVTWTIRPTNAGPGVAPPRAGDVFELKVIEPFGADDVFRFVTKGETIDSGAEQAAREEPYVVPNPYVGVASFEPERFAVSGRGERRVEFRAIPRNATIRIYTVLGDLVQTLRHDGSDDAFVAWDLRTKDNLDVAPGLYIFHVDAGSLGTNVGKMAVIK
jgi:hypothetical protein